MSTVSLGGAIPASPGTTANVRISRDNNHPVLLELTETHVCQIIHSLAESEITPYRWSDAKFSQERLIFLEALTADLQLRNGPEMAVLPLFIKRLLNIFARASLLYIELSAEELPILTWPKRVVEAETLRDIGIWLRDVGLDGLNPAQLQGPQADAYLDSVVKCILQKKPLTEENVNRPTDSDNENIASAAGPKPSASYNSRNTGGRASLMSGAIRQMEEMDSQIVTNATNRPRQQLTPESISTPPRRRAEPAPFGARTGSAGASVFDERGMPAFATPFTSSPLPQVHTQRPGRQLPQAIKSAFDELAILGPRIYARNGASTPPDDAAMERYRQLSRFISQADTSHTNEQEYENVVGELPIE